MNPELRAQYPHLTLSATYSAEDNKLRLSASDRLPAELYARVKAAGFSWAPKQEIFVAPMWTPAREDLLLELCGEIDDEQSSMAERAEQRAERFETYSEKREQEAHATHAAVERIAGGIPLGQPILVGHHSERRARKDAQRIESGMRKAVKLWETAEYWERRARGSVNHAEYKVKRDVVARRISKLEAEQRKWQRSLDQLQDQLARWTAVSEASHVEAQNRTAKAIANAPGCSYGVWSRLDRGEATGAEIAAEQIAELPLHIATVRRWIAHLSNRLAYERVFLGRAPDEVTPKRKPVKSAKAAAPLLNYRAECVMALNPYSREPYPLEMLEMTAAEYKRKASDFKGTALSFDRSHRVRTAFKGGSMGATRYFVFLTDSKAHPVPAKASE